MPKTIYVGNIPWSTTEDQLREYFSEHGQVLNARIITERATGRSKGYGFVEVPEEDAEKMIEMNGTELEGRKLVVNEAKPRPE
ncbi:RNA recognition motif domain-containing protein [Dethiobacter alkaliphilus]|uniref:RNP-1 like RNA-binding protein n=1 Tax=Dethiobacter alkaliphilus AHT 1 TaxID=555088 RepID=C0GEU5_DETAL|nr:RNA-binding protein [Dethiobacter alkaliphilus]EEG78127.1 RNP-1 like RNA-binding protein [Dethiobacter alkaliphilus AHT 1]MCW3489239.1 RNA-binding protein [Dethiobacter alkaliphilus]